MVAKALEAIQTSAPKRTLYTCVMVVVLVLLITANTFQLLMKATYRGMAPSKVQTDFEIFYLVARHVWLGDVGQVYRHVTFEPMQSEAWGSPHTFSVWAYPPQFDLLIAPLAKIPLGWAYLLFMGTTLILFLLVLRALAGRGFVLVFLVFFPTIVLTLFVGQNGFLTAGLIGLVCLCLEERPIVAGVALGAMVIKPHLAIAFATYVVLKRCWIAVAAAGVIVLVSSAVCTFVFGPQIWSDLIKSMGENAGMLNDGTFPLFRMISLYSSLRTAGLSALGAFTGQAAVAAMALGCVCVAAYRRVPLNVGLGLTAMMSSCISPYVWDYDFSIFGVGLALLMPVLHDAATEWERGVIYLATMLIGAYVLLMVFMLYVTVPGMGLADIPSVRGFVLVGMVGLVLRILARAGVMCDTGAAMHADASTRQFVSYDGVE